MAKVNIGAWEIDEEELELQHQAARRRGERQAAVELRARSVCYNEQTGELVVMLSNGVSILAPTALLQGLADAAPDDLAQVSLGPRGASLHWGTLGVDFSVAGLIIGILGTRAWMTELGRRGGSVTSAAKAAAARANGKKGGRPAESKQHSKKAGVRRTSL